MPGYGSYWHVWMGREAVYVWSLSKDIHNV